MCLILAAWMAQRRHPLLVAANRDEFHSRAAAPARFWTDRPQILAGRDLEANGTWLGVSRSGRFAAVTNYRGGHEPGAGESRGLLVSRFLDGSMPAAVYVADIVQRGLAYSGYNLLACDGNELWWHSNRSAQPDGAPLRLAPGIHGLGNFLLDTPEVETHKSRFARAIESAPSVEGLISALAPARIVAPQYGTRCSTVVCADSNGRLQFAERSYDAEGGEGETVRYEFSVDRHAGRGAPAAAAAG